MTSPISRVHAFALILGVLMVGLNPPCAFADDASRISRLESELQQLRIRIDEQNRRIQRLEEELKARSGGAPNRAIPGRRVDKVAATATDRLPWHSAEPWARVIKGMSEAEVTAILGEPTSIESFDGYTTLFYRGTVPGSGPVNGHVNLRDDRVLAVNRPVFGG